ncbi:MAG: ethanolamine ammonia-lyase reactivating factor EutA, partial [Pseudomonadota bacterium]
MIEEILSVGIDIGTSTTQLVFSRISIENTASFTSVPRICIISKEVVYRSEIYFTPLVSQTEIDGLSLKAILQSEYEKAGIKPGDIKTGVAIITGETARKKNASQVMEMLSGLAGDFVVSTAGPDLEGIIAGKGSGAQQLSRESGRVVANLDIGGGTTNIAIFRNGEVIDTCCLDIGGRLIKLAEGSLVVQYIAPKLKKLIKELGIDIEIGRTASVRGLREVTARMAGILEEVLGLSDKTTGLSTMLTAQDLKLGYKIDYISFSGGVADYIYGSPGDRIFRFGDIGILLGESIKESMILRKFESSVPAETIRATVIGAGTHTVDISGSTINYTRDVFPVKNVPILKLAAIDEGDNYERVAEA